MLRHVSPAANVLRREVLACGARSAPHIESNCIDPSSNGRELSWPRVGPPGRSRFDCPTLARRQFNSATAAAPGPGESVPLDYSARNSVPYPRRGGATATRALHDRVIFPATTNSTTTLWDRDGRTRRMIARGKHGVASMSTTVPQHHGSEVVDGGGGGNSISTTGGAASNSQTNERERIDFNDPTSAHGTKTVSELLRAILVLNACRVRFLADRGDDLLRWSYRIVGKTLPNLILRETFFKHFCAGTDAVSIRPTVESLRNKGNIESILDYAAESEHSDDDGSTGEDGAEGGEDIRIVSQYHPDEPARVYRYESEAQCDRHKEVFSSCIRAVRDVSPERGFAALKVTALGNPLLLERLSCAIVECRRLFAKFDTDGDGLVSRDEFEAGYRLSFVDADTRLPELLDTYDPDNTGQIDYITWSKFLSPLDLPDLISRCREVGPLARACPSHGELRLLDAMHGRAHALAAEAAEYGTRLLFDAEQTYYQPAIDNLVLELQQTYNSYGASDFPIVFNTYQCYLKDMPRRMILDVERADRFSYHFGAKLVRGAYMDRERERAAERGYDSPINDTLEDTHATYDDSVEYLLRHHAAAGASGGGGAAGGNLEVMCATHNQASIERAIGLMDELGIEPTDHTVHFAQLFGMADNLTFTLGSHGFQAYKYVPYGEVDEAIPYLLRRAKENGDMLANSKQELSLLYGEIRRRMSG